MTTYTTAQAMVIGADTQLRAQCYGALLKLSADIVAEAESTVGHPVRLVWARRVRRDPSFAMQAAQTACAFNSGIRNKFATDPTTITDAEVDAVLAAATWTMIAEALA
jgi:hypothetical protein